MCFAPWGASGQLGQLVVGGRFEALRRPGVRAWDVGCGIWTGELRTKGEARFGARQARGTMEGGSFITSWARKIRGIRARIETADGRFGKMIELAK